jgi:DNA-binding NarL/FixJ family response regulator
MNQHYITVISENVITRALIVEYLTQNQGYKVTSCDSIALFLESLRLESHIDIILLEVTTHGQNALKHFYKLGKLVPNAKVLVFFEHLDKDLLIEAIKDGAAGYYALNTNFKLLSLAIENLMNNNRVLSPEAVIFLIEALKENPTPPPPKIISLALTI